MPVQYFEPNFEDIKTSEKPIYCAACGSMTHFDMSRVIGSGGRKLCSDCFAKRGRIFHKAGMDAVFKWDQETVFKGKVEEACDGD